MSSWRNLVFFSVFRSMLLNGLYRRSSLLKMIALQNLPGLESGWVIIAQSCPTLFDPIDCSLPGSPIHVILQARILEWVAISFSRGSSQPRDWTLVSCIAGRFFTSWAPREALGDQGESEPNPSTSVHPWVDHTQKNEAESEVRSFIC